MVTPTLNPTDCIFCKIIDGKIPTRIILQSEKSLAFLDAFPLASGHSLVIPKKHYEKIQQMPPDEHSDLFGLVQKVTEKVDAFTNAELIAVHNGKESGQEIPHVHVH
ncbi:MAG: HIT family protein, partial [Nitrosopumilaceae archaeon]|nr:HIT family protein [Nitrosopumilaceae archaeon]